MPRHNKLYIAIAALAAAQAGTLTNAESIALEEVIVTAQRRAESVQDAAIPVDAIRSADLTKAGVFSAEDLGKAVPAITISNGGGASTNLYMRGVGNRTSSAYVDGAIAVSYDGVFMGRASGASAGTLFDIERVEVLKGPQGTLYGRNATGGAVNIIPVEPSPREVGGYINADIGNYDNTQLQGALNLPVGDSSAVRLSGNWQKRDGLNKDGTSDVDTSAVRAQFLTEITDDLTIRVGADYSDFGGEGIGATYAGTYRSTGLGSYALIPSGLDIDEGMDTAKANAYRRTLLGAPGFGFLTGIQDDWYNDNQFYGINAEITYNVGDNTLTVIPAWRKTELDNQWGVPGFNSGWTQEENEQASLEARLAGSAGNILDFVVGAFYINETIDSNNTYNQEYVLPLQEYEQEAESWAIFSHLTWNVTDTTRLVTAARYTDDKKDFTGQIDNYITFCGGLPGSGFTTPPNSFATGCATPGNLPIYPTLDTTAEADAFLAANGAAGFINAAPGVTVIPLSNGVGTVLHTTSLIDDSYTHNKATFRVAFEKDLTFDSLFYMSYETGYRSGGFQLSGSASQYKPEYLDAYTIGSKNRFLDGSLQVNAELFYWKYKDQQITYFTVFNGVLESLTDNVGSATSQGVDLDVKWAASANTLITAKLQYLDASYDDLHFRSAPPRDNINCPSQIIGATNDGTPVLDFNCSGNDAVFSPKLVIMAGISQTVPIASYNLIFALNSQWRDEQVSGFWNLQHERIEDYTQTNLDITLEPKTGEWYVTAYARNLEDERRTTSTQASPMGMAMATYGEPLMFGLRAAYNF